MTPDERRRIGGLNEHFLYFGSMRGAGTFHRRLLRTPAVFDRALDVIPTAGDVSPSRLRAYFRRLPRSRTGIATATRLLAMKRPDKFVCVNDGNRRGLAKAFNVPQVQLSESAGYQALLNRVWRCPWYRSPRPRRSLSRQLWDSRVALLDAFYYDPGA